MARILEVVTRWDDTLLDVVVVADGYAIAGIDIVRDGKLVGEATGHIGHVAYSVEPIERPARTVRFARGDGRRVLSYVAAMLALHLGLWAQATASDRDDRAHDRAPGRLARARSTKRSFAHADHVPPREPGDDATHGSTARGQGMAMKGAAGAAGADAPIAPRGHVAVKNLGEEVRLSKGELLEQARHAGILGHAAVIEESYQAMLGPDRLTSGFDPASVTAPLDGGAGAAAGAFGLARHGLGESGGGSGWGTIGTGHSGSYGSLGAIGHGWNGGAARAETWQTPWQGGDYVQYAHVGHRIGRSPVTVAICAAPDRERCRVAGELDAAIVRRYVRRNIMALTYCFEKELLATPTLAAGPVFADFVIEDDGKVVQASATGTSDAVAACATTVLEKIEFPRAGGPTHVEYVLSYRRSGA